MKIMIACDMEGITGVTRWEHVTPSSSEYPRFRQLMTDDVNAIIRGAFDGGATEIELSDGHSAGQNLLLEKLDPRARLNQGNFSPWSMVNGIERGADGIIFAGYHAKAGTPNANLAHTWDGLIYDWRLNGQSIGEFGMNSLIAGHFNIPVIMSSGDQTFAEEAKAWIPEIETAIVKIASGYYSGLCYPPEQTAEILYRTAKQAVIALKDGKSAQPKKIETPILVECEFTQPHMAEAAARLPGCERFSGRGVRTTCDDIPAAFGMLRLMANLAS